MPNIISLVLGGGAGTRLFPLTKDRSKPAVPIGGKYRLIDIPISNCLNSNIYNVFILTQFNSASLNKHVINTYRFDNFQKGFVDILAAEQSTESKDWYQGTADAVRKNLKHILAFRNVEYVLILSGDQIYQMDYRHLIEFHKQTDADITVSVIPCTREEAKGFGIVKLKDEYITKFVEKPKEDKLLDSLTSTELIRKNFPSIEKTKEYVGSMGIYLFNTSKLIELLDNNFTDFGKELIPYAIENDKVAGYQFNGYWEDVGTIKAFLKANLDFTSSNPMFDFYETSIYTHARFLPSSSICDSKIDDALIAEGTIIHKVNIKKSVIGIRSIIGSGVHIENSVIMGNDYYENQDQRELNRKNNIINIGIGENTVVKNAIIDKDARIGKNCKIINQNNLENHDSINYYIRDKVIIIPKYAVLPDNTVI
ncbi:MAG: glucose-1-phosphate adenylyltransferase [Spirochaetes bacterium]|nr:glucose-1-phosphate adenylyltransferase [Spirochaetota bacterium]